MFCYHLCSSLSPRGKECFLDLLNKKRSFILLFGLVMLLQQSSFILQANASTPTYYDFPYRFAEGIIIII